MNVINITKNIIIIIWDILKSKIYRKIIYYDLFNKKENISHDIEKVLHKLIEMEKKNTIDELIELLDKLKIKYKLDNQNNIIMNIGNLKYEINVYAYEHLWYPITVSIVNTNHNGILFSNILGIIYQHFDKEIDKNYLEYLVFKYSL